MNITDRALDEMINETHRQFLKTYPAIQVYICSAVEKKSKYYYFVDRIKTGETRQSFTNFESLVKHLEVYIQTNYINITSNEE